LGRDDREAWATKATFGLLEPIPKDWTDNKTFPATWEILREGMGYVLLELEIDPEKDPVYIADRAHKEGYFRRTEQKIPDEFRHKRRREAERAYMESKIPLKDYMERGLKYSLPEVVIETDLPPERIKISTEQPLVEETLEEFPRLGKIELLRDIQLVPELKDWADNRLSELGESRSGIERAEG
jgi:hypothetical protein